MTIRPTRRTAAVLVLLLAGAILMALALVECDGSDEDASTGFVKPGVAAPDFTLTSLDGKTISLSDYRGRPVMINYWASWCPPCRDEFPVLVTARAANGEAGFEILGITRNDPPEASRDFAEESDAEWPILPDPGSVVWDAYGAIGLPTSYFVDPDGIVQRVHIGPMTEDQMGDHLAAIGLSDGVSLERSPSPSTGTVSSDR